MTKEGLFLVAVVGGVGAGKTTVCKIFEGLGLPVIYADEIARNTCKYKEIKEKLLGLFGEKIVSDGAIDRIKLGKLVFENKEERERMEAVVLPVIDAIIVGEVERWRREGVQIGILDIPLLEKSSLQKKVDEILFVEARDEDRLRRVVSSRGWSENDLLQREQAQTPLAQKRAIATRRIINTTSISPEELNEQCQDVLLEWRKLLN